MFHDIDSLKHEDDTFLLSLENYSDNIFSLDLQYSSKKHDLCVSCSFISGALKRETRERE